MFISLFTMMVSGMLLFWLVRPPAVPHSKEIPVNTDESTSYHPAVKPEDLGYLHLQD